ncbi:MAG TPA: TonB-dependent receptor [Pyrinomonadaceae bacterium]
MLRKRLISFAAVTLLLAISSAARAQVTGGSVTGTVADAQGGVVANATVNLLDKQRGQTLTTQTTGTGQFNFPNVAVGDYTISIEQTGFATLTKDVRVELNQVTTVDATLQAAGVSASINVAATSDAVVETDSSQLSRSFDTRQVLNLPVFGNQNALALLSANVAERSAGVVGSGGTVGGTRPRGNSFNVDGVDNNDAGVTGPVITTIQDSIQEFSLLTNNYNAEFGAGSGGQFNTITKGGTNEFHGSGFYYVQSERFNAASTTEEQLLRTPVAAGGIERKPLFRDHRYGGTLGGPILKNKLFFFGAFERETNTSAAGTAQYFAPTSAGLTQIAALPGASAYIVNLLRENLTLAPVSDQLFNVLGTPIPFGSVTIALPAGAKQNLMQINIDHLPNSNNQFRYRFSYQKLRAEQSGGEFIGSDPRFNNLLAFDARLFSMTWVRTINSNLVNDMRLSYRRSVTDYPLKNSQYNDFPNIVDLSTSIDIGPNGSLPQGTPVDNYYQMFDAVTYTRGNHTFKFGGEARRLITTTVFLARSRGDYWYTDFDQLIRDLPAEEVNLRGVGEPSFVGNQWNFFGFGQDDWKITPNLTLNLGLRYEYSSLPRSARLQALNAISNVPGVIEFATPKTDKNNFAPRIGFAYAPVGTSSLGRFFFGTGGQSALRANFAVTYYTNFQNLPELALPPQVQTELNFGSASAVFGLNPNGPFLQNGGLPGILPPVPTAADAREITQGRIPDQISPYSISWTLSYQRELSSNMTLEMRYLSTRGRHLPVQVQLNAGAVPANLNIPTFFSTPTAAQLASLTTTLANIPRQRSLAPFGFLGAVTEHSPIGNSQYDAGSVSLTRRFTDGLAFTGAYTWSKTIDDSTNELNTSSVNPRRAQNAFNMRDERGLSALDIPHRLSASFVYDVPFFNRSSNRFLKTAFGGFQISAIFQAQSGQPITPISGIDSNRNLDSAGDRTILNLNGTPNTGSSVRAINAAGVEVNLGDPSTIAYVVNNPNAQYIQAGPGARANAGRNTLRTRGFNRTDMTILKEVGLVSERLKLQVGAEIYDLFNQRPQTLGLGGAPNLNTLGGLGGTGGLSGDTTFASVGSDLQFLNYDRGNFFGRTIQLRAKLIF